MAGMAVKVCFSGCATTAVIGPVFSEAETLSNTALPLLLNWFLWCLLRAVR